MSFTGEENHDITLNEAADWTNRYREENPELVFGHYFGGKTIKTIASQPNCVGIRIYYALDEAGVQQLIVVGVDADENDLCEGVLAERSYPCPPRCGNKNPLNSK